jgi:hypothetical protein
MQNKRKFQIGEKVKILQEYKNMPWYSNEIYSIINYEKENRRVVILNKMLNGSKEFESITNKIDDRYLYSLIGERKDKLNKLNDV